MPPGEFPRSISSDLRTNGDSAGGSYVPSAFVGLDGRYRSGW